MHYFVFIRLSFKIHFLHIFPNLQFIMNNLLLHKMGKAVYSYKDKKKLHPELNMLGHFRQERKFCVIINIIV